MILASKKINLSKNCPQQQQQPKDKKAFMQTRWLHGVNNAILTTVKKGEAP
jgi:hypothetical protein